MTLPADVKSFVVAEAIGVEISLLLDINDELSELDEEKYRRLYAVEGNLEEIGDELMSESDSFSGSEWVCCQAITAWWLISFAKFHMRAARKRLIWIGDKDSGKLIDDALGSMEAIEKRIQEEHSPEKYGIWGEGE